jgi:hypothetical protein
MGNPREKMFLKGCMGRKFGFALQRGRRKAYTNCGGIAIASDDGEGKEDAKLQWTSVATKEAVRVS